MKHQPPYPQDINWNDHIDWDEPTSPEELDKATMLRLKSEMSVLNFSGQRATAVLALNSYFYDQTDPYPIVDIILDDYALILQPTIELIQQLSSNARIEFVRWLLNQESAWTDTGVAETVAAETTAAEKISTGTNAINPDFDPIPF